MSEADNLKACAVDLEDELTCLKMDLAYAEDNGDIEEACMIEDAISDARVDLANIHDNLVELGRG